MPLFFYRKGDKVAQRIYNEQPLCAFVALVVQNKGIRTHIGGAIRARPYALIFLPQRRKSRTKDL
jgi:hypothetical protein